MAKVDVMIGGSGKWAAYAQNGFRACDRGSTYLGSGHIPHSAPWEKVFARQMARQACGTVNPPNLNGGSIRFDVEVDDSTYTALMARAKERRHAR